MFLLILPHGVTVIVKLGLHISALECVLSVHFVLVVSILQSFFLDIGLVHSNHTLLQLLEVSNVLQSLVDVILEALLFSFLSIKFDATVVVFILQTSLSHS